MADIQKNMQQRGGKKSQNGKMKKTRCPHAAEIEKNINIEQYQKWDADKKLKMKKRK